jgi:hypothetical protein
VTAKERFRKTVGYEIPDRLPMDLIWPRAETISALKNHFQTENTEVIFQQLGIDFRWIPVPAKYPNFESKINGVLNGDSPGGGDPYIFLDNQTFVDHWGIVQRVGDDGKYLEWKDGPMVGQENLKNWQLPEVVYPSTKDISKKLEPFSDYITVTEIEFPFKLAWHMAGFEHLSMMMMTNPKFVDNFYDLLYLFQTQKAVLAANAGYDVIAIVGDVAGQLGMMFSPKLFQRFDVPRFTYLIDQVKQVNPDVKILYHSDGDIEAIIPMLVQCGIDILNPIQSACMDPAKVKKKYGDQLTFHGTISVQDTIPNGTVKDVKNEVISRIKTVGHNGGFIVSPENSIPYDAPLENIIAVYDTVREFDYQQIR